MSKIRVHTPGLQSIVRERGEVTLLDELVQNALDTNATEISIEIEHVGPNRVRVNVTDNDPVGVANLDDLNTLFAPSVKRDDASKRGFMNVGEKLAVAYAIAGEIISTTGSRIITRDEVKVGRKKRTAGTSVDLVFPMSLETMAKLLDRARTYLVPAGGPTFTVNGADLPVSVPTASTKTTLGLYVEEDGDMRVLQRMAQLDLYEPDVRGSWIYVLGIPVERVEGLPRSVDVRGRLKADIKRDQIPARELHRIKVAVANVIAEELTVEDLPWVRPTMADASDAVVRRIVGIEFGADAMTRSVNDPTANIRATEEGRNLIPTNAYPHAVGERIREIRNTDPTFAAPSHAEYGATVSGFLDDAIAEADWTKEESAVVKYARELFPVLFHGCTLDVTVYAGKKADCVAAMGRTGNTGHLAIVRGDWVHDEVEVLDTLIHEFGHFEAPDGRHSPEWGHACCSVAARIAYYA